ncbi:MAG: hypothetical protein FJ086_01780, partial [Deltaproteobacteria bacterium]|nr:hypothetical protein [Deltaproteobacteria bacterium]
MRPSLLLFVVTSAALLGGCFKDVPCKAPVCSEGETAAGACDASDRGCRTLEVCGLVVHCRAAPVTCTAQPTCAEGEVPGGACGAGEPGCRSVSLCGTTVHCRAEAQCRAAPACEPDEEAGSACAA